ncbi:phosphoenolpyruvate synthase [Helcobacillus massiliensis]|uniref:phosphoenolpyruvate synthase n=1 Tax=Helcobacillus massiliensis TaxID=521392 RepID=UPI0021A35232|nr:phosphoenolpyruvate synthase [Helcobacillus massiliensis]MCT1557735.1 phosphoenolpyruvate synthase [Helcobacillus massiliensis]MCT2036007.1 phosphoenolpyruvate synthase [Helcobacillus massiliensis]MCT2331723.1 phosphoenolpyruvate synthase [Helcobacillus massiliensis]MDK7741438.1 phosphoenolpyruvate synthase [Helcobacillus massiliensis]WOO92440.1 phosphoenolpyruvate synthase [Helcobacillus massiliensis]
MTNTNVRWFSELGMSDVDQVGGKNASLGEMVKNLADLGVNVPNGFATTADAYRRFLEETGLAGQIDELLDGLDTENTRQLTERGAKIRDAIITQDFPKDLEEDIRTAYDELAAGSGEEASFAVRSSATAEDLPDASFAGQQETFLNVRGIDAVLTAIREVFASLYNDRAIAYRVHHGFEHTDVLLSAGVQKMVRSDIGASGVMFTMDTESGFDDAVFITSAYGLGEGVVQGAVNPDEFYVYKPALEAGRPAVLKRSVGAKATKMIYTDDATVGKTTEFVDVDKAERPKLSLTDAEVEQLARHAVTIEKHYKRPMDIEWGKDGADGGLYVLQARPETVQSRAKGGAIQRFKLKDSGEVLVEGRAIGQKIGAGKVAILNSIDEMHDFEPGQVLVADMTDPDWEPIMKRASAIVTNRGGRTCHAAIIARELGIPAVVGTGSATSDLKVGDEVTVSAAEGDTGYVYKGMLDFDVTETSLDAMPEIPTKIMMNVGTPEQAFSFSRIPNAGVGLARLEFIINRQIGIHPRALLEFDSLPADLKKQVGGLIEAYDTPRDFFVQRVAEGVSTIAAAFAPNPVIVRMSDFKSNEYANLIAGPRYEPHEENPMLGYRGASRYLSEDFAECFKMECDAIKYVRDEMGLTNVKVMIPFVRTPEEAKAVTDLLAENGLKRGDNGLEVIMMCEVPSNAVVPELFLEHFDGYSIGSNDMTQLTLGLDRDSGLVADAFDERNAAVKFMLERAIRACRDAGKYVGICGQGPSDHPDLAEWLMEQGIETMSLNPDTVVDTWVALSKVGKKG